MDFGDLKLEALRLPAEDRAELAHALIQSLDEDEAEEIDARLHKDLWMKEIERRCREIDEGKSQPIPADEVLAEIRTLLR